MQAESQSASLQFCLQPPYYLDQCQVGCLLNHLWAPVSKRIPCWAPRCRGEFGLDGPYPEGMWDAQHSHTEAHPKILCEETRPASHLQKLLCSLQTMTKVLLIPQLVQAPPSCLLGPLPGQDPLGAACLGRGLAPRTPVVLVCRCQVPGLLCRGWAQGPGSRQPGAWWQGKGFGRDAGAEVLAWPWSRAPLWPVPSACALRRGSRLQPHFLFPEVYRLWYISPKSLVLCFGFFSLFSDFF